MFCVIIIGIVFLMGSKQVIVLTARQSVHKMFYTGGVKYMDAGKTSVLQEQEGLLKAVKNTDICMFWYYPKEKKLQMNEKAAKMYGCRMEYLDMPKSFADDFVHPATQEAFYEMYRRIDAGEETAQASFSSIDSKNWCTVTMTVITVDGEGKPEKVCGIVQNISIMKQQELEFCSSKRMLSDIIGALSEIYMLNYYIDLVSRQFAEIRGLDYVTKALGAKGDAACAFRWFADTLVDKSCRESFCRFTELDTLAERIGGEQHITLEYLSEDQEWYRASFIVVNRDGSGIPVQVEYVIENISIERKKELEARETLEKAYETANKANASKSLFLNNMSHDIRTPMNAIVGFSAIAAAHIDDKLRVQDCIAKITASSKHLLSIINEVLDMSRIESGKIHIQEQEASLPAILHDFMNMIHEQIRIKGLELFIDTMNLAHENVYTDEARIHRVLLNLVGNAIKFTPAGGMISIRLAEKPQTSANYGNYVISVRDTGIGMSKEFLPHVFEPFEREQTSTVSRLDGTGLGMPITKNIIEIMGGSISVESEEGKGTVFTIELPLRLMDHELEEPRIEKLAGLHAMVVDDDYNVCDSVAKMLDKIGMEPEWTMSGKEAILHTKYAQEMGRNFSAYIVDWKLPDMSGIEVVRQVRQIAGDEVPIYILTAYDFSDIEEEARRAGVTAFCQKPLFFTQLRTALLSSLGDYEEQKEETVCGKKESLFGKRVLLVEDNELNREIAVDILTEEGLIVDTAENGAVAVNKISSAGKNDYDMILMDIQMPVMDGYEATRKIRGMPARWIQRLPILAMTANAFEEDRDKALEAGMNGHLAKPIDIETLFETLIGILGQSGNEIA